MPWFAAHVVVYFRRKDGPQTRFTVWENVHLLEAPDGAAAHARAEVLGRREEVDDSTLYETDTAGARHAVQVVFAGVRKVLIVYHERKDEQLGSDDEVTFSEFIVDSEEGVRRLAAGEAIALTYTDL